MIMITEESHSVRAIDWVLTLQNMMPIIRATVSLLYIENK